MKESRRLSPAGDVIKMKTKCEVCGKLMHPVSGVHQVTEKCESCREAIELDRFEKVKERY